MRGWARGISSSIHEFQAMPTLIDVVFCRDAVLVLVMFLGYDSRSCFRLCSIATLVSSACKGIRKELKEFAWDEKCAAVLIMIGKWHKYEVDRLVREADNVWAREACVVRMSWQPSLETRQCD